MSCNICLLKTHQHGLLISLNEAKMLVWFKKQAFSQNRAVITDISNYLNEGDFIALKMI